MKLVSWTWLGTLCVLGAGLIAGPYVIAAGGGVEEYDLAGLVIARSEGIAMLLLATTAVTLAAFGLLPEPVDEPATHPATRPYFTLFLISFIALFVELLLIRYASAQIRIFSFYKNVPLIGCFLGLGLGCWLAGGTRRHVLLLLLWLIPFAVFMTGGSLVVSSALGKLAAIGSSEHILGDYIPKGTDSPDAWLNQLAIAAFCVSTLVVVTLLFSLMGRLLGDAFERVPRIQGYTVNIIGSLAGILAFSALSFLTTPPWLWFAAGLLPLLYWLETRTERALAAGLCLLCSVAVFPSHGNTVWSRYQKLVGHEIRFGEMGREVAYQVEISDVFYQVALDRSPEALSRLQQDPFPHYDRIWSNIPKPKRVLVVGAGTGNDVAAALRAGAERVDAVDIDPAIFEMGREHHPERPYDDSRVHRIVDDARHAFRMLPKESFDAVLFGLLDSHTQLGMSSLRLDNYVFTLESFAEAATLLRPGGHLVVTAASYHPWFRSRLDGMLRATVGGDVTRFQDGAWWTYIGATNGEPASREAALNFPTDDWPFLYLPERGVPSAYLWVVAAMAAASLLTLWMGGLQIGRQTAYHGHLFFLGAAFLLMEVHAINRLALLFGTTWIVSAVAIAVVLSLIVAANLTILLFPRLPYWFSYAALAASLLLSFVIRPAAVLGSGFTQEILFCVLLLSPVYFAGLVFARSFSVASLAGPAVGANILGSVLGGWIEYGTMAFGMRALVLLAAGFYAVSLLMLIGSLRGGREQAPDALAQRG